MNYYNEIKHKLIDNEIYLRVKDHSKEEKEKMFEKMEVEWNILIDKEITIR